MGTSALSVCAVHTNHPPCHSRRRGTLAVLGTSAIATLPLKRRDRLRARAPGCCLVVKRRTDTPQAGLGFKNASSWACRDGKGPSHGGLTPACRQGKDCRKYMHGIGVPSCQQGVISPICVSSCMLGTVFDYLCSTQAATPGIHPMECATLYTHRAGDAGHVGGEQPQRKVLERSCAPLA